MRETFFNKGILTGVPFLFSILYKNATILV